MSELTAEADIQIAELAQREDAEYGDRAQLELLLAKARTHQRKVYELANGVLHILSGESLLASVFPTADRYLFVVRGEV